MAKGGRLPAGLVPDCRMGWTEVWVKGKDAPHRPFPRLSVQASAQSPLQCGHSPAALQVLHL